MMMITRILADGLAGRVVGEWVVGGLVCLLVATLLELAILPLIWKRFSRFVAAIIVGANFASACLGGAPYFLHRKLFEWDVDADPWAVYHRYWEEFLPEVAALFLLTCLVEFICFLPLRFRKTRQIGLVRLAIGTLVGNVASYVLLVCMIWYMPPRGTGDFELTADANWVQSRHRVWFVDPDSHRLCSIRLDGMDRRTESNEPLLLFNWYSEPIGIYAIIPAGGLVLYVDENRNWRLREGDQERRLDQKLPETASMRPEVAEVLIHLLPDVIQPASGEEDRLEGVYFSAGEHYWRWAAAAGEWQVKTNLVCALNEWGTAVTSNSGTTLGFGIKRGVAQMFCRDPEVLKDEDLITFRCGGWVMVMDPVRRKVAPLVHARSIVLETPYFRSTSIRSFMASNAQ